MNKSISNGDRLQNFEQMNDFIDIHSMTKQLRDFDDFIFKLHNSISKSHFLSQTILE